ncbi:hypothetical protein HZC31_03745 [Candidatus Woesearchaeota archaeon]|nr:hypothetical protein [Candidatus Woesearchaeota archaeon]
MTLDEQVMDWLIKYGTHMLVANRSDGVSVLGYKTPNNLSYNEEGHPRGVTLRVGIHIPLLGKENQILDPMLDAEAMHEPAFLYENNHFSMLSTSVGKQKKGDVASIRAGFVYLRKEEETNTRPGRNLFQRLFGVQESKAKEPEQKWVPAYMDADGKITDNGTSEALGLVLEFLDSRYGSAHATTQYSVIMPLSFYEIVHDAIDSSSAGGKTILDLYARVFEQHARFAPDHVPEIQRVVFMKTKEDMPYVLRALRTYEEYKPRLL